MNEQIANKINVGQIGISNVSLPEVIDIFNNCINNNEKMRVCVTPVNCIVWANRNSHLKHVYNSADITLCDGVPVLWGSKFLGTPLKQRVTGLDLFPAYIEECYKRGYSFFLLGAKQGVGLVLKEQLDKKFPGIKIAGVYSPPFADTFTRDENKKMITLINEASAHVLWVSLTAPKQDFWIAENLKDINVNIAIGVGGAFEVTAGLIKRAPVFMQRFGLEWLFRFIHEPKRLFKRYIVEAPAFIPIILKQKFKRSKPSIK